MRNLNIRRSKLIISMHLMAISIVLNGQSSSQEAYISRDKPFYIEGETVWYSLFLYNKTDQSLINGTKFMELSLVTPEGMASISQKIRVENGRVAGQIRLPEKLKTANYLLVLTYPSERVQDYVYSTLLPVFSKESAIADPGSPVPISNPITTLKPDPQNQVDVITVDGNMGNRSQVTVRIDLSELSTMNNTASVVVRKKYMSDFYKQIDPLTSKLISTINKSNSRAERAISFSKSDTHGSLLYKLRKVLGPQETAVNAAYIKEDQKQALIFEEESGNYMLDASNLSPGRKTFYFNHFYFLPWSDNRYRYVRKRWMNGGEMTLEFVDDQRNFDEILPEGIKSELSPNPIVEHYLDQLDLLKRIKQAYPKPNEGVLGESVDESYLPSDWYKVSDYAAMENLPEFLREVVSGLKYTRKDGVYDFRFSYPGDKYRGMPFIIVDGIPTLDVDKVFNIPIKDIEGVGVLKDLTTSTEMAKQNREDLKQFGYFGENGILFIKLKGNVVNPLQQELTKMPQRDLISSAARFPMPEFQSSDMTSVPDFRSVLYWNAIVPTTDGKGEISFYTSDDNGQYEIIIEAVSSNGQPLKVVKEIKIGTAKGN